MIFTCPIQSSQVLKVSSSQNCRFIHVSCHICRSYNKVTKKGFCNAKNIGAFTKNVINRFAKNFCALIYKSSCAGSVPSTTPPMLLAGKTSPENARVRPFSNQSLKPLRLRSLWVIKHDKHSGKVANKTNKTSRRIPHKERRWSEIVQFAQEHQLGRGSTLRARGTAPERMRINMVSL